MCTRRILRIVGIVFTVLLLAGISAYAVAKNTPLAAQGPPVPAEPPPVVLDAGQSYNYMEPGSLPEVISGKGEGLIWPNTGLRPSAVEGQPRTLSWTPVRRVAVHPTNSQILYAAISNGWGIWRSTNGGVFWKQLPLSYGWSGRTVVFANDNTTALASFGDWNGSYYQNAGVYRSTNGFNSWIDVSAGITRTVDAVAFDPTNAQRIYVATLGAGIYRTTNGGTSWTQINSGLTVDDRTVFSIAVAPSNPNVLYAGGFVWVYRSDNGGDSWYIADTSYPSFYTEAVAVHRSDPNTFYTGAQRPAWILSTGLTLGGFYKSVTGPGPGHLVLKNNGMTDTFVLDIAQDPLNSNTLYAGTWASGVYRSDDGGLTWNAKNAMFSNPYVYAVEARQDGGNTVLYAATFYSDAGLFKSTDRGDTWTEVSAGSSLYPVIFDVKTTGSASNLAAATSRGVYWSSNGGGTWYASSGLQGGQSGIVLRFARSDPNPNQLLAATYGGGVWSSNNAGQSWSDTSAGLASPYVYDVAFSPGSSTTAYAGSYGVYRSTNGGASWSSFGTLPTPDWVRALDMQGDLFAGANVSGVFRSPGANGSWSDISAGLGELRIRSLKALTANNLFAGTNGASAWQYTGSWTKRGPTITAPGVIQIAIHPNNANIIYAATDQGVYRSDDGGETWWPKNQGLGGYGDLVVSGIAIDRNSPTTIYLGTWGYGIFKSTDNGDHWARLSNPLMSSEVYLPLVLRNHYIPSEVTILNETFEGAFPGSWTVSDNNSSNGYYYWGKRPCRPYEGSYSGWAVGGGNGAGLSCGSTYPTYVQGWMVYGPFSLADAASAVLTFKLWLYSELNYDGVFYGASINGNNFYGSTITGNSQGWIDRTLDLRNVPTLGNLTGQPNVWIAVIFISDLSITYAEGAYVDNVVVSKTLAGGALPPEGTPLSLPDTLREEPATMSLP